MRLSHDLAFKRLLAHPELVRTLLSLVPGCPAGVMTALERVNCSFVSTSDRQRYADMVWRVECPPAPFYALLEFQSSFDRQMAQRMKVYSGLLSQDLGAQHKRELLDVLPVVVYSGSRKWPIAMKGAASWLRPFQEDKVYCLIDEERAGNSVIGHVIRLVRGESLAEIGAAVRALLAWPMASENLRYDVCSIGNERAAAYGSNLEEIMEDDATSNLSLELSDEDKRSVIEMYRVMYMTLKDTPEAKRNSKILAKARNEGAQEGRQEGRADVLRRLLGNACERDGILPQVKQRLFANADVHQMERWVERLMAGEKLEDVLGDGSP